DSETNGKRADADDFERLAGEHEKGAGDGQREHVGDDRNQADSQRPICKTQDAKNDDGGAAEAGDEIHHDLKQVPPAAYGAAGEFECEIRMVCCDLLKAVFDAFEDWSIAGDSEVLAAEGDGRGMMLRRVERALQRGRE